MQEHNENSELYDVVVVGGGVTGCATLYTLARYTAVKRLALVEKYGAFGMVNSHRDNNSQTLHFGDIETNYSLDKAREVKAAADMLARYVESVPGERLFRKSSKMVLAVGPDEVKALEDRSREFKPLFPSNELIDRKRIGEIEPNVVKGRDPSVPLLAFYSPDGYIIDYGDMAASMARQAREQPGKLVDVVLGEGVQSISGGSGGYEVRTRARTLRARAVVVAAGPHSLAFAHRLGYGRKFILLPVAGGFFRSCRKVNGKVYMMQLRKLPFAAVHADTDVKNPDETRYGPTAKVLPMMERHSWGSVLDFMRLFRFRWDAIASLFTIIADPTYMGYMGKQVIYDLPYLGKLGFLKEARKIIPSLKASELKYARRLGGVRPQVIDTATRQMNFGEAKIVGANIIFDVTPSPGASTCLKNAADNARQTLTFLGNGLKLDEARLKAELG